MTWWYHDWWLYITDDNIWKIMFDDYLKKMTWWLSEYILNDNIRFMNGKVVWKKKSCGKPNVIHNYQLGKNAYNILQPIDCDFGDDFLGKKKRENLSIHWFTGDHFPKVWFISGPFLYSNPPKNKKNAEKCSSHVQNIAKLTVQIYLVLLW